MKTDYKAMDKEILTMRENGHTYRHIGEQFGLSCERVRQRIIKRKRMEKNAEKWKELRGSLKNYDDFLNLSYEYLNLTVRAENGIRHKGINTIRKLVETSDKELMRIPNFGDKAVRCIRDEINALAEKLGFLGVGDY